MKIIFLITVLGINSINLFAQKTYIGYPNENISLDTNDVIVINPLPWWDGKLDIANYLYFQDLKTFMFKNSKFGFQINLNYYSPNEKYSNRLSEHQSKQLNDFFQRDPYFSRLVIYEIKSVGENNIIVSREEIENYNDEIKRSIAIKINCRVEIVLTEKME